MIKKVYLIKNKNTKNLTKLKICVKIKIWTIENLRKK